jgi:hypothetical protein
VINHPGMFADFVIIEAIQKIVVTATSRRLMIFDLESLQLAGFVLDLRDSKQNDFN